MTFTCPYGTFAYRRMPFGLCNVPATFQRCMTTIFHDMIEESMEVFMDDFSIFSNSFSHCLHNLERMLARCVEANLVLNWEKCHFMVQEGIVLGLKVSNAGMEVDRAKVEFISKLPPPTSVRAARSFLRHAGFYRRFIKDFSKIARPLTQLLVKDLPFVFDDDCLAAFELLKEKLTTAPIMVSPDWELPFELMCDANDFAVGAVLGQCREKKFQPVTNAIPWFSDYANYLAARVLPKGMTSQQKKKFFADLKYYIWDDPFLFRIYADQIITRCVYGEEVIQILKHCHEGPVGGHQAANHTARKVLDAGFYWSTILQDARAYVQYILVAVEYFSKWHEVQALPTNDARVVVRYGVSQRFSTAYHPQTSRQVEVTNRGLKHILEKTIGASRKDKATKLDYRTSTGFTPFRLVYGKGCHLPVELEYKALWALKSCNFDLDSAGRQRQCQLNELEEWHQQAYENSTIYKAKTKQWHDKRLKGLKEFNIGDSVLLFNSRLRLFPGKLKSRWSGPFTVMQVFPYEPVAGFQQLDTISFRLAEQTFTISVQQFGVHLGLWTEEDVAGEVYSHCIPTPGVSYPQMWAEISDEAEGIHQRQSADIGYLLARQISAFCNNSKKSHFDIPLADDPVDPSFPTEHPSPEQLDEPPIDAVPADPPAPAGDTTSDPQRAAIPPPQTS
ncbi:uncharacterized protein LOC125369802 [Ricinus communis]|uniref:uncharacterized protein LOC125369802 n=1 Tax=Ricinus communis TaxID=3988 RepID=UPI00201A3415|nr:uncharacterized protein LOC125369802 [Ricinus communis]